jgi:NADPH:quinone reductase-like Zn-dependent oxidoreductase
MTARVTSVVPSHPMKAITYCEYGAPNVVLKLTEIEKPTRLTTKSLVRVRAASVNPSRSDFQRQGSVSSRGCANQR